MRELGILNGWAHKAIGFLARRGEHDYIGGTRLAFERRVGIFACRRMESKVGMYAADPQCRKDLEA